MVASSESIELSLRVSAGAFLTAAFEQPVQSLGVTHKIVRGKFAKSLNLGGMGRDLEPSH